MNKLYIPNVRKCFANVERLKQNFFRRQQSADSNESIQINFSDDNFKIFSNHAWTMDKNVNEFFKDGQMKPRDHPGMNYLQCSIRPNRLIKACETVSEKYRINNLANMESNLDNIIWSRKLPLEKEEVFHILHEVEERVIKQEDLPLNYFNDSDTAEKKERFNQIKSKILNLANISCYKWKDINFTQAKALAYANIRTPYEYACLTRVLLEIKNRDANFSPKTLFDFGSGVGSVIWASNEIWPNSIYEYYCVEKDAALLELSDLLLRDGQINKEMFVNNIYLKSFMPKNLKSTYSVVVSSFSSMFVGLKEERLEIIKNLWKLTNDYLIFIENGTLNGFKAIEEARSYILQLSTEDCNKSGHVFSPCPHDLICPRLKQEKPLCPFVISYKTFPKSTETRKKFCFVVIKKGDRESSKTDKGWPRLMNDVKLSNCQASCYLCNTNGKIEKAIITKKKHGKSLYWCARKSKNGDLLPMKNNFNKL